MKKEQKEYFEKYGEISNGYMERFHDILKDMKLKDKEYDKLRESISKLTNRKWNNIDFVFYMEPKPTSRPRSTNVHKRFYVKNASNNHELFKEFIDECNDINFTIVTPTRFNCDIYMPMPNSMNKIEKICAELKLLNHISRPDFDNLGKTYSDMIQGYFLLDDSLIVDSRIRKFYSFKPRIEIHIEFMDLYDCRYNKKKVESWGTYNDLRERIFTNESII